MSERKALFSAAERKLLERVIARAKNLSSAFPYQRHGEALHLKTEDWALLATALGRAVNTRREAALTKALGAAEVRVKELEQQVSALSGAPGGASWADRHVGRSWVGHPLEDDCPCPKQPCGLVKMSEADPGCDQHAANSAKTIRQAHDDWCCPARPSQSEGALPASSVVPVEAGTGTDSATSGAPAEGQT